MSSNDNGHAPRRAALYARVSTDERAKRGWTQAALAREADLSPTTIMQLETGRVSPTPITLVKIGETLGIDAAELLALAEEEGE